VDQALANLGRSRRLAAVASHYLAVASILRESDLLCTMARRIAVSLAEAFGLVLLPVPDVLALGSQPTSLVFHNRYAQRPAHRWLRALISEAARGLVTNPVSQHDLPGSS
jgi:DNA-binding transcriptional LysR family regulator